jgi:hypothetical protein
VEAGLADVEKRALTRRHRSERNLVVFDATRIRQSSDKAEEIVEVAVATSTT